MLAWVLGVDSVIAAALLGLIVSTRIAERLVLPRRVYLSGATAGLQCGSRVLTYCSAPGRGEEETGMIRPPVETGSYRDSRHKRPSCYHDAVAH
jgi:hypothetical protein